MQTPAGRTHFGGSGTQARAGERVADWITELYKLPQCRISLFRGDLVQNPMRSEQTAQGRQTREPSRTGPSYLQ